MLVAIPRCRRLSQWNTHDSSSNFYLIQCDNYSNSLAMCGFIVFSPCDRSLCARADSHQMANHYCLDGIYGVVWIVSFWKMAKVPQEPIQVLMSKRLQLKENHRAVFSNPLHFSQLG